MATPLCDVPALGNATYEETRESFLGGPSPLPDRRHSEETAREIDLAVRRIVDDAFERAHSILTRHRDVLEASAAELQEREHLAEGEPRALLREDRPPRGPERRSRSGAALSDFSWTEYTRFTIALTAVLDPLAVIPVFLGLTRGFAAGKRARAARVAALSVAIVLAIAALTGESLLAILGTSLAAFRVGGGIVILMIRPRC
ncbi:MAG: MarC family protein [Myxococcota bacterium]